MKTISILVGLSKDEYIPNNELLVPIHLGASLSDLEIPNSIGDNTGDNISEKNHSYCELTGIYWAWKNLKSDYIGLFHYRRYLSFNSNQSDESDIKYKFNYDCENDLNLNEKCMRKIIEDNDIIIPKKNKYHFQEYNIYDSYDYNHYIDDLNICIEYIKDKYPEISKQLPNLQSNEAYLYNISIMKKEIYNEYCLFLFDVLDNFDKKSDTSSYNPTQYRVQGYLGERLTNLFIHYIIAQKKYKIKELQVSFFENTEKKQSIEHFFKKNNIPIVLTLNNYYIPYLSVLLHSIIQNASKEYNYDFVIFNRDFSSTNKNILTDEFKQYSNINIRFYDMKYEFEYLKNLFITDHLSIETYFRLYIQDIMKSYDKVLYLDGDIIVNGDISELYNENIEGKILGAVKDPDFTGQYNSSNIKISQHISPGIKDYVDKVLKIKKPFEYFQAGVILFNITEMNNKFSSNDLIDFSLNNKLRYMDQDTLNFFAQGKVKFLNPKWNVLFDCNFLSEYSRIKHIIVHAPKKIYDNYMDSRKNPKIIHYAGIMKPWETPESDFGEIWWKYAKYSSYYAVIIDRMVKYSIKNSNTIVSQIQLNKTNSLARRIINKLFPYGTRSRNILSSIKSKLL
jgi:lipopolysaccharide biosynthesis glycosyltransferase